MRLATLALGSLLLLLAATPSAPAVNACVGASDGLAQVCTSADWDEPALCARVDLAPPGGSFGTGTCAGA